MTEVVLGGEQDPTLPVGKGPECREGCPYKGEDHYHGRAKFLKPIPMSKEMQELLAGFQQEDKRLREAGTPYWCVHNEDQECYWCRGTGKDRDGVASTGTYTDEACPVCDGAGHKMGARSVTHPQTGWINDGFVHPLRKVRMKHGAICYECWGYVQEG